MPAVTFKWQLFENISQKPAKILIFVISVSFILPQRECVLFKIQLFMERSSIGLDHSCGCSQFQLVQKYFYVPCINEASLTHKPCKGACQSLQRPGDKHHAAECYINELCSHSAANKLERLEPCDPTPVNKPCWPLFYVPFHARQISQTQKWTWAFHFFLTCYHWVHEPQNSCVVGKEVY